MTHNRTPIEAEFRKHLKAAGVKPNTRWKYMGIVRRFLKHIGDTRLERLSEDLTRSFFDGSKGTDRKTSASAVSQFLTFAMARLPVPVNARGAESPRAAVPTKGIGAPSEMDLGQARRTERKRRRLDSQTRAQADRSLLVFPRAH